MWTSSLQVVTLVRFQKLILLISENSAKTRLSDRKGTVPSEVVYAICMRHTRSSPVKFATPVPVWYCLVWNVLVWFDMVWFDMVWYGRWGDLTRHCVSLSWGWAVFGGGAAPVRWRSFIVFNVTLSSSLSRLSQGWAPTTFRRLQLPHLQNLKWLLRSASSSPAFSWLHHTQSFHFFLKLYLDSEVFWDLLRIQILFGFANLIKYKY